MNKLEVGMYVRTKEFGIQKVKWFDNEEPILENGFTALQKDFKASHNIIDLIEVGDYVNGMKVDSISKTLVYHFYTNDMECAMHEGDIKSIVTKEQFKSMEYRLGE